MKVKKRLCMLLMMLFFTLGLVFSAACSNNPRPSDKQEGPESGVYYYDSDEGEYLVSLNKGDQAVFTTTKLSVVGTYSVEGSTVTFNVPKSEQNGEDNAATFYAKLADNALTVTYEETECRFLKKVMYSVAFETGVGGDVIPDVSVMNGKTVAKPADPVREGYIFLGWYADAVYQKLYNFETESVTGNTKLYARWTPTVPGRTEYEIGFDLNYEGAESVASIRTIGGKLYNVTTPQQEGYDFGGWWVSPYNDPDKLSYACNADTVFEENLTLYAKWLPKNTGSKLAAPVITVKDTGISWTNTAAATYAFEFAFVSEDGTEQKLESGNIGQTTSYAYDFSSAKAGTYVVRVTSVASVSANNSDTSVVYYINKGLARVSSFNVSGDALIFNAVPHAEKYLITVDCGNKEHNHTLFDNGTSTYYNFSNCEMQEGGIKFTVTAVADGYASSTSETFVYERTLEAVSEFAFDKETETLSWKAVPSAASYVVTIKCGEKTEEINVGGKTKISLKEYAPAEGGIQVSVYPKTKGYNSPEASTYTYNKTALAVPSDIKILGTTLTWSAVEGAGKYEIRIGNKAFMTEAAETTFDLSSVDEDMGWMTAKDYRLSIRAYAAENSAAETSSWSDDIDIRYYALYSTLSYAEGRLSWRHVVGAVAYEVKVNDGLAEKISDGSNSAAITFTRSGENILSVRFFDGDRWLDWATISVRAYEISFDSRSGSGVKSVYKASGDILDLPESSRLGYEFGGWYNTPSGAVNGALYADEFFGKTGDIMLYAYWIPATYKVVYDCGEGNTIDKEFTNVLYSREYTLDIPVPADGTMVFMGWFSEPNGGGRKYTDESGKSFGVWNLTEDKTAIAYWQPMLSFKKASGGYSVVKNRAISSSLYINITIPAAYQGPDDAAPVPVVVVEGSAFAYCNKLENIRIPNSVTIIENNAFSGCTSLKNVEIYEVEGVIDPVFSSIDGSVIYKNPRTSSVDLFLVPRGLTGKNGVYIVPDGVRTLPAKVFYEHRFSEIVVSKDVALVEENAFYNCDSLLKVTFAPGGEGGLLFFGDAFKSCDVLRDILLPARLSGFDADKFASCTALENLMIEEGEDVAYVSDNGLLFNESKNEIVFCPAGRTGSISFDSQVVSVGSGAFRNCKKITEVVFHGWMQSIGEGSFEDCTALVKITFKGETNNEAVSLKIGKAAFQGCTELNEIVFEEKSRVTEIGEAAFNKCTSLVLLDLPASLATIGTSAFEGTKLEEIAFAENGCLATIGKNAFKNLKLSSLRFPASLETIAENAFGQNYSLASVEFTTSETELKLLDGVFQDCRGLESIEIPANVVKIGVGVFNGCSKLSTITVDENNDFYLTQDGVLFDKNFTELLCYPAGKTDAFTLPEKLTTIGAGVFKGNKSLTNITIHKHVTLIAASAFENCSNLEEVNFEQDVTDTEELVFGEGAFKSCKALTSLVLPARVTAIPADFTHSCEALTEVVIPSTVTTIAERAFNSTGITNMTIPNSVETIGQSAFYSLKATEWHIEFEDGDKPLEVGNLLFSGGNSKAIGSVKLPERLVNISEMMFFDSQIEEIVIPSTVTTVDKQAFYSSKKLHTVTFRSSEDPDRTLTVADGNGTDSSYTKGVFSDNISLRSVTLPDELTRVADFMFYNCAALEEITIPNSVSNRGSASFAVGRAAFMNCTSLRTVNFETGGKGEITIGGSGYYPLSSGTGSLDYSNQGAFYGCVALERVNFPENLAMGKNINNQPVAAVGAFGQIFEKCTSLASFAVARGEATDNYYYTEDEGRLLCYKSGSENILLMCAPGAKGKVVVPNTITKISHIEPELAENGDDRDIRVGFDNCQFVEEIEFQPGGAQDLVVDGRFYATNGFTAVLGSRYYNGAFSNMPMLQRVTLPARLTALGGCAFAKCPNLTELVFENGSRLLEIGDFAFLYTGLTEMKIPASVATLGDYLFADGCLERISLPDTLTSLGSVFANCSTVQEINLTGDGNGDFKTENGVVYKTKKNASGAVVGRELAYYPVGKKDASFVVPADVVSIAPNAFSGSLYLKTLTFADSKAALAADGSNALIIGESAFSDTEALTSVTIPVRTTSIGRAAFASSNVETVVFEDDCAIQTISEVMFWSCSRLSSVVIPKNVTSIDNGAFINCSRLQTVTFAAGGSSVQLYADATSYSSSTIPGSSTYAKYGVFQYCKMLETIDFNGRFGGTVIGPYTFYECNKLSELMLGNVKVENVGKYAFYKCAAFTGLDLSSLTTDRIYGYTFYGCASLETVTLSGAVAMIEANAFYGCTSLETVTMAGNPENSYTTNIDAIGKNAFVNCARLKNIDLKNVSRIEAAFKGCTSLTEANLSGFASSSLTSSTATYQNTLAASTFEGCTSLAEVTLPLGLKKIGSKAFFNCESLVSLVMPDMLETIDTSAFEGCVSLASIDLSKVKYIQQKAFLNCESLTSVDLTGFVGYSSSSSHKNKLYSDTFRGTGLTSFTFDNSNPEMTNVIPARITSLAAGVFAYTQLTSVTFEASKTALSLTSGSAATSSPSTSTSYTYGVFEGCALLSSVDFGERNLKLPRGIFRDCVALEKIEIGKAVTAVDAYAFYGCAKLSEAVLPTDGALKTVGENVFTGMTQLSKVTFTGSGTALTSIGDNAFQNTGIAEITIPACVTNISEYAFEGCLKLEKVTFAVNDEGKAALKWIGGGYSGDNKYASYTFANCPLLKTVTFPEAEQINVGDSTFANSGIEQLTLSDGVYAIGYGAFEDCAKLGSVTIKDTSTLAVLNSYAFANTGLKEMPALPKELTSINAYVFSGCRQMTKAMFPSQIEIVYEHAFENCTALAEVVLNDAVVRLADYAFQNCTALETINLPGGLEQIDKNPFAGCVNLTSIDTSANTRFTFVDDAFYVENTLVMVMPSKQGAFIVPQSVTEIADGAFAGTGVSEIVIQNPDTVIGSYAFAYTKLLQSVKFPDNVALTAIPEGAFAYSGITAFEIPASVLTIGDYAFAHSALTGMTVPETVTGIGGYAFYGCAALETLAFGADTYEIFGDYMFANSGVSSIVLPSSVTAIGDGMFEGCANLESVTFNGTLTSIGAYAFRGCGLTEFIVPNTVTEIAGNAFGESALETVVFEEGGEVLALKKNIFAEAQSLKRVTLSRVEAIPDSLFENFTSLEEIVIPSNVVTIGKYAFRNTENAEIKTSAGAESLVIPASVAEIKAGAFAGSGITAVEFAEGDAPIKLGAGSVSSGKVSTEGIFHNTAKLKSVTFSSRVESIAVAMFYGSGIETLDLPERIEKIGNYAFAASSLRSMVIPDSISGVPGTYIFSECAQLETVTLSKTMTRIFMNMFENSGLKSIVIPANITDVYSYSFKGCSSLTSVTFEGEAIKIAKQSFMDCTAIEEIVLPAGTVVSDVEAFSGWTDKQTIKVLMSRQNAEFEWKDGWNIGCNATIVWTDETQA